MDYKEVRKRIHELRMLIIKSQQEINELEHELSNEPHWRNTSLVDIEGEVWKDLIGWEGQYRISNKGRLKSLARLIKRKRKGTNSSRAACDSRTRNRPRKRSIPSKTSGSGF